MSLAKLSQCMMHEDVDLPARETRETREKCTFLGSWIALIPLQKGEVFV